MEALEWGDLTMDLVDTGGLRGEADIALADRVHEHTVAAIAISDVLIVLFDAKTGLNPLDGETVELVTRSGLPAIYVANKAEGRAGEETALEFCALGIDVPIVLSAEHGQGISELREEVEKAARLVAEARAAAMPEPDPRDLLSPEDQEFGEDEEEIEAGHHESNRVRDEDEDVPLVRPCRVALVGRPNVGKSSFLNLLAGQMLSLVDNRPGTTRDVVDTEIVRGGRNYVLLDTAGMRRPSRVEEGVERISVRRSLEAIERADVVVVIVEPEEGVTDQDARIARHAWVEGRALILLVNKSDLATEAQMTRVENNLREVYPTMWPVPVGRLSVLKGRGVDEAFTLIDQAFASHNRRLRTPEVNRVIAETVKRREPPVLGRGRVKFFYGTQTAVRPPSISIFTNRAELPEDYQRFLERNFREEYDFTGTPLRLRFVRRDSHGNRDVGDVPAKEKTGRDRRGLKARPGPGGGKPRANASAGASKSRAKSAAQAGAKPSASTSRGNTKGAAKASPKKLGGRTGTSRAPKTKLR